MRIVALAALVGILLLAVARPARASVARASVDDANAALSAVPARRDAARAALHAATAATDDPEATAEAYVLLGQLDEDDGAYARALANDRAAIQAAPGTRWAFRASDRVDWLRARSEGNFAPLARLERVRHDPALSSDPSVVEALAREADTFPPGMVRVEARMLVAEAWLGRLHRPEAAIPLLRQVTSDPKADPLTARLAERELVDTLIDLDRLDEAQGEASARASLLEPTFVKQVRRLRVRRRVRFGAEGALLLFALLASMAFARAGRDGSLGRAGRALRSLAPVAGLFVALVAVAGGTLASRYESGNAAPFYALGAAVLPLVLLARAWGAVGSARRAARAARAAVCAAAVVAMAFVLLETLDPQYLTGFGL